MSQPVGRVAVYFMRGTPNPFPLSSHGKLDSHDSYKFKTCRGLKETVDTRSVWLRVFSDLSRVKPSIYSAEDVEELSTSQLKEASQRIVQVDRAFSLPNVPHREVKVLESVPLSDCFEVTLFPGGERVLVPGSDGSFDVYDIATGNLVLSAPRIEGELVNRCFVRNIHPTSIHTGYILVSVAM